MARYVGIHGFRRGWVAAWIDDKGDHGICHATRLADLLPPSSYARAMIDVPVGLPRDGYRSCDREAREVVGPSVFLGARRDLWTFPTHPDANKAYHSRSEPGVSIQLWSIRNKIRDADEFITPERQHSVRESHPEVAFFNLNDGTPLARKKSEEGRQQRISLLKREGFTNIDEMLNQRRGTGIAQDDLIDACVCAIVARDSNRRLPEGGGGMDARGLRMEIWY